MAGELKAVVEAMCKPWVWGETDCCASACNVFKTLHGVDPMVQIRGTYNSAKTAFKIINNYGGFVEMCDTLATQNGLTAGNGEIGEIGIVISGDKRPILSICINKNVWAAKSETGFLTFANPVRTWTWPQQ